MTSANTILNIARKYLGVVGGSTAHHKLIDRYNSVLPLPVGYKVRYSDDWCATFVSFIGIEVGDPNLFGRECGVQRFIDIFKQKNIWNENGNITPKPGDIICFNWDDSTQENDGWADHIGFVESVNGNMINTIEGNKGNKVARRQILVGYGYIRGYARPNYGGVSEPTPLPEIPTPSDPTNNGTTHIVEDGKWGPKTAIALSKIYGTFADGVISHQYRSNANRYLYAAQFDNTQIGSAVIKAIQKALNLVVDGLCGPKTIMAMQKRLGTYVDGVISPVSNMVMAMQRKLNLGLRPF